MKKGGHSISSCLVIAFIAFGLLFHPILLKSGENPRGNIVGFVYENDGATPLEGALIKFKNVHTESIYDSSKSDRRGYFKIEGIDSGVYLYGILSPKGDYNSEGIFGLNIRENETAKMAIAISPFENKIAESIQEFYAEQKIENESLVGKIMEFDQNTMAAKVFIIRGLIQTGDVIHTVGENSDFIQDVKVLQNDTSQIKKAFVGQKAFLKMDKNAYVNDLIYVVKRKGLLPLLLTPVGIASIVAGSSAIVYGSTNVVDKKQEISPFKK